MNYLLDTNIVLIYTRDSQLSAALEQKLELFNPDNNLLISVVSIAELKSLALQRNYGANKLDKLEKLLNRLAVIDINFEEILDRYAEIDAFSKGLFKKIPSQESAKTMGKNDLWIAATSSVYDLILVTTDKDFDHLDGTFIQLNRINLEELKNDN